MLYFHALVNETNVKSIYKLFLFRPKRNKNSYITFNKENLANSAFTLVVRFLLFLNCQRWKFTPNEKTMSISNYFKLPYLSDIQLVFSTEITFPSNGSTSDIVPVYLTITRSPLLTFSSPSGFSSNEKL